MADKEEHEDHSDVDVAKPAEEDNVENKSDAEEVELELKQQAQQHENDAQSAPHQQLNTKVMSQPVAERRNSITQSVSMRDWLERQVTMQDVEELMDLNESRDKEEYQAIRAKLQTRLDAYNAPNPFVHTLSFSCWEKFKIFLFIVTGILIIKAVLMIIILLFCYLGAVLKNCCCKSSRSVLFSWYIRAWVRIALFFMFGFYWIPIKYANDKKPAQWPMIITPNHVSLIDAFVLIYQTGAVFVAKKELSNIPVVGALMQALGVVWVDRSSKAARKEVINVIKRHAANHDNPPLIIFPQGTCSNTQTITQFKPGAFIPAVPVLPTAIHYTNCFCDMALLSGLAVEGLHICCQFVNFVRVEFLDAYSPSDEEANDAILFANNVRKAVADALGAEMTLHSFDDLLLMQFAEKLGKKKEIGGVHMIEHAPFVMDDCYRKLRMNARTVIELAKLYMTYCDENGAITLQTFCRVFHIKDQVLAIKLFELIMGERDTADAGLVEIAVPDQKEEEEKELKQSGKKQAEQVDAQNVRQKFIMFDDFLVGVAVCYQQEHIEDALTLFFSMMDRDDDAAIVANDCVQMVKLVERHAVRAFDCDIRQFCLTVFDIEEIENSTKRLNYAQFVDSVQLHKQTGVVQRFLQFIIFTCLGIRLDEKMVVVKQQQ